MSRKVSGSCLCGHVKITYDGAVGPAAYCHCIDCRKCTGSAFNVSVAFSLEGFEVTAGTPAKFTKRADSGNELTRHFCPECGSPIYTSSPRHADRVYVKAGILNDPGLVRPSYQSWTRSAVHWAKIDPDIQTFETVRKNDTPHDV